jgi:hypothetical protein
MANEDFKTRLKIAKKNLKIPQKLKIITKMAHLWVVRLN